MRNFVKKRSPIRSTSKNCEVLCPAKLLAHLLCLGFRSAQQAYKLFECSPDHPSLRFKKLSGTKDIWSVRISSKYRAVGRRNGEDIHWFWVGSHNDFDNLFG